MPAAEMTPEREEQFLADLLRERAGIDPGNVGPLADLAAIGLVNGAWRNTCVENWHAEGRMHDGDMLRVNSYTTWRVRQLMHRWMRETGLDAAAPASALDDLTADAVWWLARRLYLWLVSPSRRLPTGVTLAQLAGADLARRRPQGWRDRIEVVAMDGFTGFKTAAAEELPDAVAVMDPSHVARLAGDALDLCRRRVQQARHGHPGRKGDPLCNARRTLHTGADLLTDKQAARLRKLFASDAYVEVEATWGIYQRMIAAYREPDCARGRELMVQLIESLSQGVPAALTEVITLGRTLTKRAADVLAYFDRPGTSNGPTEAINGRLEHLRGSTLGFRNLTN